MSSVFSHALRSWKHARAVALLAIVALAVGIGSTTAIYTVVNAVMLTPLAYANGERFVALYGARFSEPKQYSSSTFPDLQEYQRRTTSFDVFGWFRLGNVNMTAPGEPQHVNVVSVTPALANNLGVAPIAGRWFTDETGAVISAALWRRLGGDRTIVGQPMTLDGRRLTITGVMPRHFKLPVSGPGGEGFETDVWVHLDPRGRGSNPGAGYYFAYARRQPGVTFAQAEADVKAVAAEIAKMDPASHPSYTARLDDLHEGSVRQIRPTLLVLFAAAGLLLVIACANVAGLLLARSVARARETATRVALGASPRQLALQYFVEGLLVSTAGALAGVIVSVGLVQWVLSIGSEFVPHPSEIAMDWTVFVFALAMGFVTSALSSLAPLWQAARTAPADVLSAGVRASAGARVRRLSQSLVVAEMALAFTLLAVGAALILHLQNLVRISPGFDAERLLTFSIALPDPIESNDAGRVSYQRRLVDALEAIPGVSAAGFANQLPLAGCCQSTTIYREGRPVESIAVERTSYITASPGYFRAMRIPLRRGRFLTDADTSEDPLHVVINQSAATRYWGNDDPIGGFGRFGGATGSRFQVVGVVGDVRNNGLGNPTVSEVYLLSSIAAANPMRVVVRSALPADTLVGEVRRAVRGVDATLPIHDVLTMDDIVRDSLARERVGSLMSTCFAVTALLMATLGVYGLLSYGVRQRTVEIGTRMALGADPRDILSLVIGGGMKLACAGVILGAAGAIAVATMLTRFLEIERIGWLPFAASTLIVIVVAIAASSFPAWRAARLSPMVAIRSL